MIKYCSSNAQLILKFPILRFSIKHNADTGYADDNPDVVVACRLSLVTWPTTPSHILILIWTYRRWN